MTEVVDKPMEISRMNAVKIKEAVNEAKRSQSINMRRQKLNMMINLGHTRVITITKLSQNVKQTRSNACKNVKENRSDV